MAQQILRTIQEADQGLQFYPEEEEKSRSDEHEVFERLCVEVQDVRSYRSGLATLEEQNDQARGISQGL